MIRKGIHQLLLPRLMSWKVLDGAVKVSDTRCHWVSPEETSVTGCTIWSFIECRLSNCRLMRPRNGRASGAGSLAAHLNSTKNDCSSSSRSEERRVGKECRSRWSP